jgi:D-alanyl-D-alanine dipeptidase
VDPTILVEIRYQSAHNFIGRPIDGYLDPVCLLPKATVKALRQVQVAAAAQGYSLKVYECYRPLRATADFLRWRDTPDESMRAEFYPSLTKPELFDQGYIAGNRSAHSAGDAVDLTLVRLPAAPQPRYLPGEPLVACTAPVGQRFGDNSIDMGTGYDCFDPRSRPGDTTIGRAAQQNRLRLRRLMSQAGFTPSKTEWWHFELPGAGTYYDFPVARASVG